MTSLLWGVNRIFAFAVAGARFHLWHISTCSALILSCLVLSKSTFLKKTEARRQAAPYCAPTAWGCCLRYVDWCLDLDSVLDYFTAFLSDRGQVPSSPCASVIFHASHALVFLHKPCFLYALFPVTGTHLPTHSWGLHPA